MEAKELFNLQSTFYDTRHTQSVEWRIDKLKKLQSAIKKREADILDALKKDLNKSPMEAYATEMMVVYKELKTFISDLKKWAKPKRVRPSIMNFRSSARIYSEPYGSTLIISPWNYPFQLAIGPLIGAVAAGNTVTLKPSEFSKHTSAVLNDLISETFHPEFVSVKLGDAETAKSLLKQNWDYIFFTGSPTVGKKVYQAAAKNMTPVTLELGGKNPCVVAADANIKTTARRIVWSKFMNAGQTCIAPDYLIVNEKIVYQLIELLTSTIEEFYGKDPRKSPDYARIISDRHMSRMVDLLDDGEIIHGGGYDKSERYLSPTLIKNPSLNSKVMADEIFGPILPILTYTEREEIEKVIKKYPKPLGGYIFTKDKDIARWFINHFSFGVGAVNDAIVQFVNQRLPFGGVGNSGIGSYHGRHSFETFSHQKSVVHRKFWPDFIVKYPPYEDKLEKLKKFLG